MRKTWPFNSRPHEEVDSSRLANLQSFLTFQFTTSRGGRLSCSGISLCNPLFQFTTSRGGRLFPVQLFYGLAELSIHDLTRRSTPRTSSTVISPDLSIHDLTRRSTLFRQGFFGFQGTFQFTTSRGGRLLASDNRSRFPIFQFTTSRGGRLLPSLIHCLYRPFNSRPHEEVDMQKAAVISIIMSFNSRPHEEVDIPVNGSSETLSQSIHDLTRRSTLLYKYNTAE